MLPWILLLAVLSVGAAGLIRLSIALPERASEEEEELLGSRNQADLASRKKLSLIRRARLAIKQGVIQSAEELLYQASGLDERDPVVLGQLIDALVGQDKIEKAAVVAERLVSLQPTEENLLRLGQLLLKRGIQRQQSRDLDHAIESFQAVLKHNHENIDALNGLADAYEHLGDYGTAVSFHLRSLDLVPNQKERSLAMLERFSGVLKLEQRERLWRSLLDHFSEDQLVLERYARYLMEQKRYDELLHVVEPIKERMSLDPALWRLVSIAAYQAKQHDLALSWLNQVIEHPEVTAADFHNLALIHLAKQALDEAEQAAQQAIDLDAGSEQHHFILARIRTLKNDPEGAKRAYQRVLDRNPEHYEALRRLKRLRDK